VSVDEVEEGSVDPHARPSIDDPDVQALLARLGVGVASARDLGGTMSLNLHLEPLGLVVRIHKRSEAPERVRALRTLRRSLADHGLTVGSPVELMGQDLVDVGGRVAEAETFIAAAKPPATWDSYVWMYEAMGWLHRAINVGARDMDLPSPTVATYATPEQLRVWIATTAAAVEDDPEARRLAEEVTAIIDLLDRQWIAPELLPQQLVHGDVRLGNVAFADDGGPAHFDFGFAARRPRIHELAYSLLWIVLKPDDTGRADAFDWMRVAELTRAYESAAGVTLDDLERRALGPYLAAVPAYLAAISSYTPDPAARIRDEVTSLQIARWILEHPDALLV